MEFSDNWLAELKKGNEQAYKALFYAYFTDLVVYANSILHNKALAEDIVQEFFVSFWYDKKYMHINSGLEKYFYRSVHNLCLNSIRDNKRQNDRLQQMTVESTDAAKSSLDEWASEKEREEIYRALHQLPEQCKQVFILCCLEGLKYREAAERLGISINTVRTQMGRAFKFLRDALSGKTFSSILYLLFVKHEREIKTELNHHFQIN